LLEMGVLPTSRAEDALVGPLLSLGSEACRH
jgi:hypothetical protein